MHRHEVLTTSQLGAEVGHFAMVQDGGRIAERGRDLVDPSLKFDDFVRIEIVGEHPSVFVEVIHDGRIIGRKSSARHDVVHFAMKREASSRIESSYVDNAGTILPGTFAPSSATRRSTIA